MATKKEVFEMYKLIMRNFLRIHKSPLSKSIYNQCIESNRKSKNVVRVSDHWNWQDYDEIRCSTHQDVKNGRYISLGKWIDGKFDILLSVFKYDENFYEGKYTREHDKNYLYIIPGLDEVVYSEKPLNIVKEYENYGAFCLLRGVD